MQTYIEHDEAARESNSKRDCHQHPAQETTLYMSPKQPPHHQSQKAPAYRVTTWIAIIWIGIVQGIRRRRTVLLFQLRFSRNGTRFPPHTQHDHQSHRPRLTQDLRTPKRTHAVAQRIRYRLHKYLLTHKFNAQPQHKQKYQVRQYTLSISQPQADNTQRYYQ